MKPFSLLASLIAFLSVLALSSYALTTSGIISKDETWSGEVVLTGDVTVTAMGKLDILPGTTVKCEPNSDDRQGGVDPKRIEIIVDGGTLVAKGNTDQRIVFTSAAADKKPGDWYGLRFIGASVSTVMQYCTVQYGVNGVSVERGTLSSIEQWVVENCIQNGVSFVSGGTLTACTIRNNGKYGVELKQAGRLSQCTVIGNGDDGVHGTAGYTTVIDGQSRIEGNAGDGFEGGSISARDSQFLNNKGYGINVSSTPTSVIVISCSLNSNVKSGLYVYGYGINNCAITVSNTNMSSNGMDGLDIIANAPYYSTHSDGWQLTFSGNTITGNGGNGISLWGYSDSGTGTNNWKVTIYNNVINSNGGHAVLFYGSKGTVEGWAITISQNQMQNNGNCGIRFRYELEYYVGLSWKSWSVEVTDNNQMLSNGMDGVGMSGTLGTGASINTANWNVKVGGNSFRNNGRHGVNLPGDGSWTVDIAENTIQASGRSGVYVAGAKSLSIQKNTIHDNVESGIWLVSVPAVIDMTLNTISGASVYGVRIDSVAKDVQEVTGIENNNFVNDGLYVFYNGSVAKVVAPNNYWGAAATAEMDKGTQNISLIYDKWDKNDTGDVEFKPYLPTLTVVTAGDAIPPVVVTDLTTSSLTDNSITLTWTAPGDDETVGIATAYDIRYSSVLPFDWDKATKSPNPPSPKPAGALEEFTVIGLSPSTTYYFALKAVDEAKNWSDMSNTATGKTITGGPAEEFKVQIPLTRGVNMISLPLKPDVTYTASTLASALDSTIVIQVEDGHFDAYVHRGSIGNDFEIQMGKGYIVNLMEALNFETTGKPWGEPVPAAPSISIPAEPWAFVIAGQIEGTIPEGGQLRAINLRTGESITAPISASGQFTAAFVNMSRKSVVAAGDEIITQIIGIGDTPLTQKKRHIISREQIANAYLLTYLSARPEQTQLLQNYPNPFNPETWIPYQLAKPADVTIHIYNARGQLVRTLWLGQQNTGFYVNPSKAAYWNGRNASGEKVASGIYFYQLTAGDFTATRRMVIVK